jgi:DNA-binding SARP family transcriptional activator
VLSSCVSDVQGGLLENLPAISQGFDEWLRPERARLAGLMAQTLRRRAVTQITTGDYDAAVETASRLVGMDTLDEAGQRLLIEALARAGRRIEALQQFEICSDTLLTELDIAPDAETVALIDRIRAGTWPPKVRAPATIDDSPIQSATSDAADIAPEPVAVFPTRERRARPLAQRNSLGGGASRRHHGFGLCVRSAATRGPLGWRPWSRTSAASAALPFRAAWSPDSMSS